MFVVNILSYNVNFIALSFSSSSAISSNDISYLCLHYESLVQGNCTRKLLYQLHLNLLSYCQTKYDNQNKETKHLLKLFGSALNLHLI